MTWAYPATFWGFFILPLIILAALLSGRNSRHVLKAIGKETVSWDVRSFLRNLAMLFFAVLVILAAADPRSGRELISAERSGLDVAVAFDVSRSMLAEDLIPNRLQRSVLALEQITRALEGSRFSLTPFRGDANLLLPMTEDRVMLNLLIPSLGPGLSTAPGTDVEAALRVAWKSFPRSEGRDRVILLISDGESLKGRVERISRELAEVGIPVFVMAVGTVKGSAIPSGNGGFVKDPSGRTVVSRADVAVLRRLAEETGGSFHMLSHPTASSNLIASIDELQWVSENQGIHFAGASSYRSFLFPALLLVFFYLIVRIVPWRTR